MIRLEYGSDYCYEEKRKLIKECGSISEAFSEITKYLDKIKYKSFYQRISLPNSEDGNKEIWIDYGSHTNFFYINGFTDDEYYKWIRRGDEE